MPTAATINTVDVILLRHFANGTQVLLIQRAKEPYQGLWALPGGKLEDEDASLEDAAVREIQEETGITLDAHMLSLIDVRGNTGRDPRGRYISTIYTATVRNDVAIQGGCDAGEVRWFFIDELPALAFDHTDILDKALAYTAIS